jgi:transitional endoplasmic reticulum ATPase
MDGIEELKGVVVVAATNRLDLVDTAFLRSGRFDLLLELPLPDENARLEIFKINTKNKPLSSEVDLKRFAKETENMVGSDIEFICKKASLFAIREFTNKNIKNKDWEKDFKISMSHFKKALELVLNQKKKVQTYG